MIKVQPTWKFKCL